MKESKPYIRSKKQQMKLIEEINENYYKKNMIILEEESSLTSARLYCEENVLDYETVLSVLNCFKFSENNENLENVPVLLLDWIVNSNLISEKNLAKALKYVNKNDPNSEVDYLNLYKNPIAIKKHCYHRNEKPFLRTMRVSSAINKKFYRYLVDKELLIDYRLDENKTPKSTHAS